MTQPSYRDAPTSQTALRTRLWRDGALVKENFPFSEVSDYLDEDSCLLWVHLHEPDAEALAALGQDLHLDELAIEDAIAHHERPKATHYASHTFLSAHALYLDADSGELCDSQISAFITKHAVITVHAGNGFDVDELIRRWDDNSALLKSGPGALVYGLLDLIVDGHFDVVQALDDEIEDLEDVLFEDNPAKGHIQRRTFALRKTLVRARRSILPMREVVNTIVRRDSDVPDQLRPYYEDLYDHVLRASEWTESLRDMVTSLFETNLSLQDARLNTIMKKLTSYTVIIAVPTAITGFYGQNVPYPGFGSHLGLLTSVAIIVVLAVLLWAMFKRKEWL